MRFLLVFFLLLLLAVMSGGAVAFHFFGIPGVILAFLGLILALWLAKRAIPRLLMFFYERAMARHAVLLRNAIAEVHSVTPTVAPTYSEDEFDEDDEYDEFVDEPTEEAEDDLDDGYEGPYDWYYVDVTIAPRPEQVASVAEDERKWDPESVTFVPADKRRATIFDFLGWCQVADYEVWDGVGWEMDQQEHTGPMRVRYHVGLKPGIKAWRLCYWTERFGEVVLVDEP